MRRTLHPLHLLQSRLMLQAVQGYCGREDRGLKPPLLQLLQQLLRSVTALRSSAAGEAGVVRHQTQGATPQERQASWNWTWKLIVILDS